MGWMRLEDTFGDQLVLLPCPRRVRANYSGVVRFWTVLRMETTHPLLCNLPVLPHLHNISIFAYVSTEYLYKNSCISFLVHSVRKLWLHLFYALSLDISFNHLRALCWTHSSVSICFLYWETESAELRRLIQIRLTVILRFFRSNVFDIRVPEL